MSHGMSLELTLKSVQNWCPFLECGGNLSLLGCLLDAYDFLPEQWDLYCKLIRIKNK